MLRAIAITALACALGSAGASAQADLSDAEVDRRLRFLEERLDASRRRGQIWFYGWTTIMVGNGVGNAIRAGLDDSADVRTNAIVEASKSVIGLSDMMFRPLEARHGAEQIRAMPSSSPADRLRQLDAAQAQLEANAKRADQRWLWQPHVGNLVVNLVGGAFTAGFGDWSDAAVSFGTGVLGGEARIWTEPSRPRQDWEDYERFKATGQANARGGLQVIPTAGGLSLNYTF